MQGKVLGEAKNIAEALRQGRCHSQSVWAVIAWHLLNKSKGQSKMDSSLSLLDCGFLPENKGLATNSIDVSQFWYCNLRLVTRDGQLRAQSPRFFGNFIYIAFIYTHCRMLLLHWVSILPLNSPLILVVFFHILSHSTTLPNWSSHFWHPSIHIYPIFIS